jgi:hypothetical protein
MEDNKEVYSTEKVFVVTYKDLELNLTSIKTKKLKGREMTIFYYVAYTS